MASASSIAAPKAAAPLRARRAANAPTVRAATIRCAANNDGSSSSRRDALLQLASLAAAPALLTPTQPAAANVASIYKCEPVDALPPAILDSGNAKVPIAAALRAQTVYAGYAVPIIEKNVTVPLGTLISLAARDAGTFDASTNTGGLNGSIRFELDRPENKKVRAFFVLSLLFAHANNSLFLFSFLTRLSNSRMPRRRSTPSARSPSGGRISSHLPRQGRRGIHS